jgi:hypothetical protein
LSVVGQVAPLVTMVALQGGGMSDGQIVVSGLTKHFRGQSRGQPVVSVEPGRGRPGPNG